MYMSLNFLSGVQNDNFGYGSKLWVEYEENLL